MLLWQNSEAASDELLYQISLEIIKPIPSNSEIILENLTFNKPTKSEKTFKVIFGIIPGNFNEVRDMRQLYVESDFRIYDLNINLFKICENMRLF